MNRKQIIAKLKEYRANGHDVGDLRAATASLAQRLAELQTDENQTEDGKDSLETKAESGFVTTEDFDRQIDGIRRDPRHWGLNSTEYALLEEIYQGKTHEGFNRYETYRKAIATLVFRGLIREKSAGEESRQPTPIVAKRRKTAAPTAHITEKGLELIEKQSGDEPVPTADICDQNSWLTLEAIASGSRVSLSLKELSKAQKSLCRLGLATL
jgi:hypothetical protein